MTNEISLQILRMKMKILKFVLGSLHQKKKMKFRMTYFLHASWKIIHYLLRVCTLWRIVPAPCKHCMARVNRSK